MQNLTFAFLRSIIMGKTDSKPTKSKSKTPIRASRSGKAKSASHKAAGLSKILKKQRHDVIKTLPPRYGTNLVHFAN